MGALPPIAGDVGTELAMMREAMEAMIVKHNFILDDANSALLVVERGLLAHETGFHEHERKIGILEASVLSLDQRVASCDTWLRALSTDMTDSVEAMITKADEKAATVMQQVNGLEKALTDLDMAHRLQTLETNLGPTILEKIEGSLNRDVSRSIEAMAQKAVESVDGAAMGRIAAQAIRIEGHDADLKAAGVALDEIRKDGQRLQDAVQLLYDGRGQAQCPCASGKCPCKCSRERGPDPLQANDSWARSKGFGMSVPTVHPMSPNAPGVGTGAGSSATPMANPHGVGAGLGAGLGAVPPGIFLLAIPPDAQVVPAEAASQDEEGEEAFMGMAA